MKKTILSILIIAFVICVLYLKISSQSYALSPQNGRALPPVMVNTFSSEIVLNSRLSYHDGYSDTLSNQILANVLWAAARAPLLGSFRTIYVALQDDVYIYDPDLHELLLHKIGNQLSEPELAFEVGVASELIEDAGAALQYAQLAVISFWDSTSNRPSCCPKRSATIHANSNWDPTSTIHLVNCYGHMPLVRGITDSLVAFSSDMSLPEPSTDGLTLLEDALSNLIIADSFGDVELSLQELSQIAWASYGCTPHDTDNGRAGISVASAYANYYLTGKIYIVRSVGVEQFHNRDTSGVLTSRDHRIVRITDGDTRPDLRNAVPRLPHTAANYFVYCADTVAENHLLEAAFCGANALLQATSIGRQGHLTANFTPEEQTAIINALGIPPTDLPLAIFSAGVIVPGIDGRKEGCLIFHEATPNPFGDETYIRYGLATRAHVTLRIYDAVGRRVKVLVDQTQSEGNFSIMWDGMDEEGNKVPYGTYYYVLEMNARTYKRKIVKVRSQYK